MIVEELIGRLTLQTKGLDKAKQAVKTLAELRKALQGLASSARTNLSGPVNAAKGFKQIADNAKKAAQAQKLLAGGGDFGKANAGLKQLTTNAERLRKAYIQAATAQRALGRGPTTSGGSWIAGELKALRDYQRLQKQIARHAKGSGVPRSSVAPGHSYRYGDRHPVGEATAGLVAGGAVARGSQYAVAQGANILQEGNRQRNAGMTEDQISTLDKRAIELSAQFPSVDTTTISGMGRDARNMFPNFDKAMEALPELVRARVMLQASKGVKGADDELQDFMKAEDILGKTEDVGQFRNLLNGVIKATAVEGKQLPLREYRQFAKMSKAGGVNLSDEFMTGIAPTFMQSEGGARFGTQIAAGISSLISGRRTKKSTAALEDLGLLDDQGKLKNAEKYQSNPYQYATEEMMPAMRKKKINVDDDKAVSAYMARIFSNAMTENLFTKLITQRDQVERNLKTYRGAKGLDAAGEQTRGDPYVGLEGFVAQVRNFLGVTQKDNVAAATSGLASLSESIGKFTKGLSQDPAAAQGVGLATGAGAVGAGAFLGKRVYTGVKRIFGVGDKVAPANQTPIPPGEAAKIAEAINAADAGKVAEAPKVGPQASAMDAAARTLTKIGAAAAIGPSSSLAKGDQDALVRKLVGGLQREGRIPPAAAATPTAPTASATATAAVTKPLEKFDGETVKTRLAEIQAAGDKVIETLGQSVTIKVDSSGIDAAQAKAEKLKTTLAGMGSVSGGGGLDGANLAKGSNSFTSAGATAP